ncbi:MAG TPA: YciI family protein [Candidatus Limnocylindrales bacterium]
MRYMLLIYQVEGDPAAGAEASMADMQPWIDYTNWLAASGMLRAGDPLAPSSAATSVRVQGDRRLVTDGPFAETKEVLGGYYILECDDLDAALDAAARCPAARDGTMEVRPIVDFAMPTAAPGEAAAAG